MITTLEVIKKAGTPNSHILSFGNTTVMRTINDILLSNDPLAELHQYTRQEILNFPCCLFFTSGSTGERKTAIISQNTLICFFAPHRSSTRLSIKKLDSQYL
ncbi:unnamed protein product [Rhizopus stolonifer]